MYRQLSGIEFHNFSLKSKGLNFAFAFALYKPFFFLFGFSMITKPFHLDCCCNCFFNVVVIVLVEHQKCNNVSIKWSLLFHHSRVNHQHFCFLAFSVFFKWRNLLLVTVALQLFGSNCGKCSEVPNSVH